MIDILTLNEHQYQPAKRVLVVWIDLEKLSNGLLSFLVAANRREGFDRQLNGFFVFRVGLDGFEKIVDTLIDVLT